jgi:drug/metabolite transporter (DMT)-like permease
MTNKNAFTLALVMAGLAATSYHYGHKGTAIVAIMVACVFAAWPIRLKRGLAGREQWREIRPKGTTHFVITYGVAACGLFAVWIMAVSYVADNHLPKFWAWQLFLFLCAGCLGGLWEWRARERKYSEQKGSHPER